jgi:hypothetical protein
LEGSRLIHVLAAAHNVEGDNVYNVIIFVPDTFLHFILFSNTDTNYLYILPVE